jgi:hypothetical protein
MKQKNFFRTLISKVPIVGFFILFFLFSLNVFAATNLSELSQPNILNTLKTQSTIAILNTLNNANIISKLIASDSTFVPAPVYKSNTKNIIILPVLKINKIDFPLMRAKVISVGSYINSDYNNYLLQPISDLETTTLSLIGNGLINTRDAIARVVLPKIAFNTILVPKVSLPRITLPKIAFYVSQISLPKINLPNINEMANVVNANISILTQNISKNIATTFSVYYNDSIALFNPLFTHTIVEPLAVAKKALTTSPVVPLANLEASSLVAQTTDTTIDCGTSIAPKLDIPASFENNSVLACLGKSALSCENAKGVLTDSVFPTIIEINKTADSCNFRLSYTRDSTLSDVTGKKLSLEYVTCPVNVVKGIDDTDPALVKFTNPNKTDLSQYGSQIYLYGTLGLFVENNMDQNKIQSAGCSGDWIDTVIASYNANNK